MSDMRIKMAVLLGTAAVAIGLLASAGPSDEWRGPVVLNPRPPEGPRTGLKWDLALPEPTTAPAAMSSATSADTAREPLIQGAGPSDARAPATSDVDPGDGGPDDFRYAG